MNTKSNSETDMKTKQPGINFVPDCQTGFPDHVLVQVYCAVSILKSFNLCKEF